MDEGGWGKGVVLESDGSGGAVRARGVVDGIVACIYESCEKSPGEHA